MNNNHGRLRRTLAGLAGVAAIATMSLAFTTSASAAPGDPTGDWGRVGAPAVLEPGSTVEINWSVSCQSAGGCDYIAQMDLAVAGSNGGTFTPGTVALTVDTAGEPQVGTCTVTVNEVHCVPAGTGHVPQGTQLHATVISHVASDAPAESQVFQQVIFFPSAGNWQGNDPTNDIYAVLTPPVAGAPMADLGVAGGIGGAALLLSGAVAIRRRRRKTIGAAAA